MLEMRIAREDDINSLKELYSEVFKEDERALELFFERIFKPEICYIAFDAGELVSMVYLIPSSVNGHSAGYLYAAATKEPYRNLGIMQGLVNYAAATAAFEMVVTLPAEDSLYDYYKKLGFKELRSNFAQLSREELEKLSKPYEPEEVFVSGYCGIRNRVLKNNFLFWNNKHIDFAFEYNALYGAKIIRNNYGYLIAYEEGGDCYVSEFICADENAPYLIADLLRETGVERYRFHLSPNQKFIGSEPERFAMVRKFAYAPEEIYVGLTLD